MTIERTEIDQLADFADLDNLKLSFESIDDGACALLGYQRTKQISRKSRMEWEAGNTETLLNEVKKRKENIIRGAFLEIYQEYIPLRKALEPRATKSVCDIGCGQAINDLFLHHDFKPRFTLVDIEETYEQYHSWANKGSGYASLQSAMALLLENGVKDKNIVTLNPKKASWDQSEKSFDLVTSLYSCGFHYPVDNYLELFLKTIENGGAVCIDLRKRYLRQNNESLSKLKNAGQMVQVYEDQKSSRILFQK